ncbi:thioredoxin family protein [Mucilaginibacter antarcticus]|uniref:Thioredoxin family protein n=1 Tax=Mucilaginibacter antarcticus TaxID=1855725 RepID=A0ABW5XN99_9SPHI
MKSFTLSAILLFAFATMTFGQTTPPTADAVLKEAYTKAKNENKKVLLMFHASWCGWCKKMDASLSDATTKKFFDDNYVITHLDVQEQPAQKALENPGAAEQLKAFKGEKSGLPFWVILDGEGKVLADSQIRPKGASLDTYGENIGCPAADNEVAHFAQLLKNTSKLTDDQLSIISKRFAQNKPAPRPVAN